MFEIITLYVLGGRGFFLVFILPVMVVAFIPLIIGLIWSIRKNNDTSGSSFQEKEGSPF